MPLTRRLFLAGSAGATLLAACGGSSGGSTATGDVLVNFFADGNQVVGAQRLPVGIATAGGVVRTDGPASLSGRVVDVGGRVVVPKIDAARRGVGLPRSYYAFNLALDQPGTYSLEVGKATTTFSVLEAAKVDLPKPGDKLPALDTPTLANARGVKPLCTANPVCPFHSITVTEALALGKPLALLVGTPAHCKTAVCGPTLEMLMAEQIRRGDSFSMIHVEVYKDDTINDITDTMLALRMKFEPALFVVDRGGIIRTRLDHVWDSGEMNAALDQVK